MVSVWDLDSDSSSRTSSTSQGHVMAEHALERFPLHLGLGARASAEPEFTGMNWYSLYAERHAADGAEGRLVSIYTFGKSWTSWQMHFQRRRSGDLHHARASNRVQAHPDH
jgi:hypothetical protein